MYQVIYYFPVKKEQICQFLRIQNEAAQVYLRLGAQQDVTMRKEIRSSFPEMNSISDFISLETDEVLFSETVIFESKSAHDRITQQADKSEQLKSLFAEFISVTDIGRIIRDEYEYCDMTAF